MTKTTQKIKNAVKRLTTLNKEGAEICDPTPLSLPTGIRRPPTQEERLRRIMNQHRQQMIEDQSYTDETDFDIDENDMLSPHERAAIVYDMEPIQPETKDQEQSAPQEAGDVPGPTASEEAET